MSGLFATPLNYNKDLIEGFVTYVDSERFSCNVRTVREQNLTNVTWLMPTGGSEGHGSHTTPSIGDKVLVSTGLAYPLILGCIPRIGTQVNVPPSATGLTSSVDTGNSTPMMNGFRNNAGRPSDYMTGDWAVTSPGGGILSLLSSGAAVIKSSTLSQIILTKFDNLVRIVARNYQRFSDASSRVAMNVKGAVYEWFGVDWDISRSMADLYRYQEIYGQVAGGEAAQANLAYGDTPPAADGRVRKQELTDVEGKALMNETLFDTGKIITTIGDMVETNDNHLWQTVVNGVAKVIVTPDNITIVYNDKAKVVLDGSSVTASFGGSAKIVLNDSSSTMSFGGVTAVCNSSMAKLSASGHFLSVDSGGVHMG